LLIQHSKYSAMLSKIQTVFFLRFCLRDTKAALYQYKLLKTDYGNDEQSNFPDLVKIHSIIR